jgi:hypothetical protein
MTQLEGVNRRFVAAGKMAALLRRAAAPSQPAAAAAQATAR